MFCISGTELGELPMNHRPIVSRNDWLIIIIRSPNTREWLAQNNIVSLTRRGVFWSLFPATFSYNIQNGIDVCVYISVFSAFAGSRLCLDVQCTWSSARTCVCQQTCTSAPPA